MASSVEFSVVIDGHTREGKMILSEWLISNFEVYKYISRVSRRKKNRVATINYDESFNPRYSFYLFETKSVSEALNQNVTLEDEYDYVRMLEALVWYGYRHRIHLIDMVKLLNLRFPSFEKHGIAIEIMDMNVDLKKKMLTVGFSVGNYFFLKYDYKSSDYVAFIE